MQDLQTKIMQLSIVIVHYKTPELLKLCLKSIKKSLDTADWQQAGFEIIVADSEAQKETGEWLADEFPEINYLPFVKNCGYAKGVNAGLKSSKGDYILIVNPDAMVTPGSVEIMTDYLKKNPKTGLVGPKLLNFNSQPQNSCFRFYQPLTIVYRRTFFGKTAFAKKHLRDFNLDRRDKENIVFPDWLMGSALLTKKSAVEKVGLMDEKYFLYFEDVDWAKRFWENGYKVVYLPQAVFMHYHHRRSRAGFDALDVFFRRETRWHIASAVKYFLKHGLRYVSGEEILSHVK